MIGGLLKHSIPNSSLEDLRIKLLMIMGEGLSGTQKKVTLAKLKIGTKRSS
jgi:hypothetical protein